MSTGRVMWIIWCAAWAGAWAVVSVLALTGVAVLWQRAVFPALAVASVAAIWLPVGKNESAGEA